MHTGKEGHTYTHTHTHKMPPTCIRALHLCLPASRTALPCLPSSLCNQQHTHPFQPCNYWQQPILFFFFFLLHYLVFPSFFPFCCVVVPTSGISFWLTIQQQHYICINPYFLDPLDNHSESCLLQSQTNSGSRRNKSATVWCAIK